MSDDPARLYREAILQHASEPVGLDKEIHATHEAEMYNPLCGDRVTVQLELANDQVANAAFTGESCAICTASASMLCSGLPGQPQSAIAETLRWLTAVLAGEDLPGHDELRPLLGVRRYPARIRCALLPWEAASKALSDDDQV